jgi:hypothetical protein
MFITIAFFSSVQELESSREQYEKVREKLKARAQTAKEWHGYSLLQSALGTYLAMNFEGDAEVLPARAMELDPDGVPVTGMLWKLNDDGSLENKATGLVLQIKDKSADRKVAVLCDRKVAKGKGLNAQRWTMSPDHELINQGNGYLLTIRNGSKANRAEVWCNFKWPLRGPSEAQRWYFRRYEGEPKAPLYRVHKKWETYITGKYAANGTSF